MYKIERRPNVTRKDNEIAIYALNHPRVVSEFLDCIKDGLINKIENYSINFRPTIRSAFPNACTPISGIIEYFQQRGISFYSETIPDYIESTCLLTPKRVSENQTTLNRAPLNRVWRFENSNDINNLVNGYLDEIYQKANCKNGVIEGLTWCLSEVMDNVIQHSNVSTGYAMGQIHPITKHIAFCIFDAGQGIFNSLKKTQYAPRNPIDAITLSIKEGITRDTSIGQGNGMWGLHNIIIENSGILAISSNSASYMVRGDEIKVFKRLPVISQEFGTTTIDFQIDFDKGISIARALGGYIPVNIRLESLENDKGNISFKLSEKTSGTGTRESGERIRNEIINIHQQLNRVIEIDFENIAVISSSFADEFIGKLIAEFGLYGFMQLFRIINMNEIVQSIINRSVSQRMSVTFVSKK